MSARRRITLRVDDPLAPAPDMAGSAVIADATDEVESAREPSRQNGTTSKTTVDAAAPPRDGKRARPDGAARRAASGEGSAGRGGRARPKADPVSSGGHDAGRSEGGVRGGRGVA